jgi:putative transposase
MARLPRLAIAGLPHLVVQRGRELQPIFRDDLDRQRYLDAMRSAAQAEQVAVHAYVLLDDQVCWLVTPKQAPNLGKMMQRAGRQYVPVFNRKHGTEGSLWADRFQSTVLEASHYLMLAIRFIEQTPVRAGWVAQAQDWKWSSAAHHTGQAASTWLTQHPNYWSLANTPFEREIKHAHALQQMLTAHQLTELLTAVRGGWPLGTAEFVAAMRQNTTRALQPKPRGRPPSAKSSHMKRLAHTPST